MSISWRMVLLLRLLLHIMLMTFLLLSSIESLLFLLSLIITIILIMMIIVASIIMTVLWFDLWSSVLIVRVRLLLRCCCLCNCIHILLCENFIHVSIFLLLTLISNRVMACLLLLREGDELLKPLHVVEGISVLMERDLTVQRLLML